MKTNSFFSFAASVFFFIMVIGGLGLIALGLFFVYTKTIKKWMHKEMKMQVSASVEHYFALSETKR